MDILKISNDTLKVMLSADDMRQYSLDCDTIENNTAESVEILREILRDAGSKCNFRSEGSKFYVQMYTSVKGDCEIFIKRLENTVMSIADYKWDSKEYRITPALSNSSMYVYSFDDMGAMISTCNRLQIAGYAGESNAYSEADRRLFYLVLEEKTPLPAEHGGRLCSRNTVYYISEHCDLICEGAVEILGRLA